MSVEGKLSTPMQLRGALSPNSSLIGTLQEQGNLDGSLSNETLRGYSAYQIAVIHGFVGTEQDWLDSLSQLSSIKWEQVTDKPELSEEFMLSENGKAITIYKINVDKINGLEKTLFDKVDKVEGKDLSTHDLTDELLNKIINSEQHIIKTVKVNDIELPIINGVIVLNTAQEEIPGLVMSSLQENTVNVLSNGVMEVNNININKLVQTEGDKMILTCGDSSDE